MIDDSPHLFSCTFGRTTTRQSSLGPTRRAGSANVKRGLTEDRSYALDDEAASSCAVLRCRTALKGWRRNCGEKPRVPAQVVFVCEHGSVKSLIAMEYFNRSGSRAGSGLSSGRAGNRAEPIVPSSFEKDCAPPDLMSRHSMPRLFEASDVEEASLVVSFDQDIAKIVGGKARHWPGTTTGSLNGLCARPEMRIVSTSMI